MLLSEKTISPQRKLAACVREQTANCLLEANFSLPEVELKFKFEF